MLHFHRVILFYLIDNFSCKSYTGTLIHLWLLHQCTDVETKEEYDSSCELLFKFLDTEDTKKDLGHICIAAVKSL